MRGRWLLAGVAASVALSAGAGLPAAGAGGRHAAPVRAAGSGLTAVIRRTEHGIPHIESSTFAGAGYGYGYAFAQDNLCVMAEDYVTVDAERSRWFGPDKKYLQRGNGIEANNLNSDFFFQQIIDSHTVENLLAQQPPTGPKQEVRDLIRGYAAGYNRYLADVGGTNGVPDKTCRGKPWVRPITEMEAWRRLYQLILLASGDVAIDGIAEAQPPTPALGGGGAALDPQAIAEGLSKKLPLKESGSNGVAIGKAGTRDHKHGLLLGNPHFPWLGTERFYQAQITVPGQMDVEGASLFGVPLVLIGHTASMAWTHTVSTAYRFTPYQLTLMPGSPTTYLYDGQPTPMTSRAVTVQALQSDGSLKPVTRTLWSTRFGMVFDSLVGVPLPWTPTTTFALGDANASNLGRSLNHFFETDRAQSAPDELSVLERYQGIPWVNTIVSDREGHALYADIGTIPNVSDAKAQQCNTAVGQATFQLASLPVLDGSRSACNWDSDPDAAAPGIFGPSHEPHLFRDDYVTNSNDSYWLSNPHQPITGFAKVIGDENTARSLRTRIGLIMTQGRVDGTDRLGPAGFTPSDMQNMVFNDRQYGGELVRNELVTMCRSFPGGNAPSSSGPVPVGNACDILALWDLHENLGSKGAILFRRFWQRALDAQQGPWSHPFDASDPVNTPNTLDTGNPQVQQALGDAINDLNGAHIPLDAAPGDVQFTTRYGRKIPIHGGPGTPEGDFNAINLDWTPQGYGPNEHGSSYVQVVGWSDAACPDAHTILTYSLSTNPDSPFAGDQTDMFSRKQWVTERFCRADVLAHTLITTNLSEGAAVRSAHACVRTSHRHRGSRHARASAHRKQRKHARSRCTR